MGIKSRALTFPSFLIVVLLLSCLHFQIFFFISVSNAKCCGVSALNFLKIICQSDRAPSFIFCLLRTAAWWPDGGTRGITRGSPKSLELLLWWPWKSPPNFMENQSNVAEVTLWCGFCFLGCFAVLEQILNVLVGCKSRKVMNNVGQYGFWTLCGCVCYSENVLLGEYLAFKPSMTWL